MNKRLLFLGLTQMIAIIALGMRDYGSDFGLRIGPSLIETINMIQAAYYQCNSKKEGLQQ